MESFVIKSDQTEASVEGDMLQGGRAHPAEIRVTS